MGNRVQVRSEILRWAQERSGVSREKLNSVFPKYHEWEAGETRPTLKQLEALAHRTHTPIGYFFLPEPPEDQLPIPDFRTVQDNRVQRPSPDLLETVEVMQRRQDWLREYLIDEDAPALSFVGSMGLDDDSASVAASMRRTLGVDGGWADGQRTWTDALRFLRERVDDIGIMVVINGVVGNNTRRKLQVDEFRGFALCDSHAPLIFINGTDAKAAQMFTLAHEIAHIWIGADGVSNFDALRPGSARVEQFCNQVAAEFLVPQTELRRVWADAERADEPFQDLARRFKVSPLVAARRALDLRLVPREEFFSFYRSYEEDERRRRRNRSQGGDFWKTANQRIGIRFGLHVIRATKEGKLLYRDAYRLTGLSGASFDRFSEKLCSHPGE